MHSKQLNYLNTIVWSLLESICGYFDLQVVHDVPTIESCSILGSKLFTSI